MAIGESAENRARESEEDGLQEESIRDSRKGERKAGENTGSLREKGWKERETDTREGEMDRRIDERKGTRETEKREQ